MRWALDLVSWIIDSLILLSRSAPQKLHLENASNLSLPDLLTYLQSTSNSSLHFLLASSTRGFLAAVNRRLQHLDYIARKTISIYGTAAKCPSNISPPLRAAYRQIASLFSNAIVRIDTVEKLLISISSHVKNAYANNTPPLTSTGPAEKARNLLEIKMLFGGPFPEAFKSVIEQIFMKGGLLDTLQDEIDEGRLFFADFTNLEVDEDVASIKRKKQMNLTMDCFKKVWLQNPIRLPDDSSNSAKTEKLSGLEIQASGKRQGLRWRRCTRCAAVSEDILLQRPSLQWLIMQQRRCFCSGYWSTLPVGETVA